MNRNLCATTLATLLISTVVTAGGETQWCLARACLGATEKALVGLHGRGSPYPRESPVKRCYQPMAKSTFMTVYLDDEDPARRVTGILVSALPNCPDARPSRVTSGFVTCRQVALGDPVEKVLGLGATKRAPRDKGYPWYDTGEEIEQFDYACEPETECSIMASVFAMSGVVIGVSLWVQDC